MSILSQYSSSLKRRESEELLDLWVYRPLAFVLARVLVHTSATPNQITAASIFSALLAGIALSAGDRRGMIIGATFYALANIFDCCDGMVARMKGNGTPLGRMVDVFADCIAGSMVYVGLGVGLTRSSVDLPLPAWTLVIAGGISFAMQAALFDRQRNAYLERVDGGGTSGGGDDISNSSHAGTSLATRLQAWVALVYTGYMRWQTRSRVEAMPDVVRERRRLRLWSLIGSTMHVTIFCIAMITESPLSLFVYTIVFGNLWAIALLLSERSEGAARAVPPPSREPLVAVILAAGTGSRLRPHTDDVPKPLVQVAGQPLLAWSIDALVDAGVRRFVLVVGYRSSQIAAFIDARYPLLDVELIYNHAFDTSNNAASLVLASQSVADDERIILLDGDLMYDPAIVRELVRTDGSALVVRRTSELSDEEVKVIVDARGRIRRIGKTLTTRASCGESIGIALFDADATRRLFRTLHERMLHRDGRTEFYEASFQQMIEAGTVISLFDAGRRACIEIDTPEDLEMAEEIFGARDDVEAITEHSLRLLRPPTRITATA